MIDDNVIITFNGRSLWARSGETIAAALSRADIKELRTDRQGAKRGIYCGMGICYECVVEVSGGDRVRACMTPVTPGMRITTDGAGAASGNHWQQAPQNDVKCDVLVVGAGPAGLSAGLSAAKMGLSVIILDERKIAGGQFFKQKAVRGREDRQHRNGRQLVEKATAAGARVITGATAWGMFSDNRLAAVTSEQNISFSYRKLIVAAGAYEKSIAFEGWTLPGVMTTGAGQTLVRAYSVSPGKKVAVAGNGPLNFQLAAELRRLGVEVTDVVESAKPSVRGLLGLAAATMFSPSLMLQGVGYVARLLNDGVRLHFGAAVLRAKGAGRVEAVDFWRSAAPDSIKSAEVDTLCIGYGFVSSNELPSYLGVTPQAVAKPEGRTNLPDVYIAGDCGGIGGAYMAMAQGTLAGIHAGRTLGAPRSFGTSVASLFAHFEFRRHQVFQKLLWSAFHARGALPPVSPRALACRCEEVQASTLCSSLDPEIASTKDLKTSTRAGMGLCQGRNCRVHINSLLSETPHALRDEPTPRIPLKPVPIGLIAANLPDPRETNFVSPRRRAATDVRNTSANIPASADVLIVGAGVIGQTTAFLLAREGMKVILLDDGNYNAAASGLNAGSLHVQMTGYFAEELFDASLNKDRSGMRELLPLGVDAVAMWKWLENELGANLDLSVHGGVIAAETDEDEAKLRRKIEFERSLGIPVEYVDRPSLLGQRPWLSETIRGGAWCPLEGKVNPHLAGRALIDACRKLGVQVVRYAEVRAIERLHAGFETSTSVGSIRSTRVVSACGARSDALASLMGMRLPVRGKSIQMSVTERVPFKMDLLLGHARTRLTMKQTYAGNLLIGGGWPGNADEGGGSFDVRYDSLRGNLGAALRVIPALAGTNLLRSWTGIAPVTSNGGPVVGALKGVEGAYVCATEVGYTLGPLCARNLVDMMTGRKPTNTVGEPLSTPFSPPNASSTPITEVTHDVSTFH